MIRLVTLLFLVLLSVSQAMAGAVGGGDLVIVDRDGKEVGFVGDEGYGGGMGVIYPLASGDFFKVQIYQDRQGSGYMLYESSDCSGPLLMSSTFEGFGKPILASVGISQDGGLYRVDDGAIFEMTSIASVISDENRGECFRYDTPNDSYVAPATRVGDWPFHPPYRIAVKGPVASTCPGDFNSDGEVKVNEVITTVNSSLNGCPAPSP